MPGYIDQRQDSFEIALVVKVGWAPSRRQFGPTNGELTRSNNTADTCKASPFYSIWVQLNSHNSTSFLAIQAVAEFEAQVRVEQMTETEAEDYEVQKRRAEGMPCNKENFEAWKQRFEAELAEEAALKESADGDTGRKGKEKKTEDKTGRITGFMQFSGAAANLQALEAAADEAEQDETPIIDEELFDDDEDLDDLDFDSDDDDDDEYADDDDEEEEELDI